MHDCSHNNLLSLTELSPLHPSPRDPAVILSRLLLSSLTYIRNSQPWHSAFGCSDRYIHMCRIVLVIHQQMGGSPSKKVKENPNFNMEEYNRRVAHSGVYNNNPTNPPVHQQNYNTGIQSRPMIESTVNKVNLDFSITKNSLKISLVDRETLRVQFRFKVKRHGQLKVFLLATETTDMIYGEYQLVEPLEPGDTEQSFEREVSLRGNDLQLLEQKYRNNSYPLIVSLGNQDQSLTTYAAPIKGMRETIVIKQKLLNEGTPFYIKEVYGLAKNSSERLCIICFSEPSDVVINPCGHMTLCTHCVSQLMKASQRCPICRGAIASYQHVKEQ